MEGQITIYTTTGCPHCLHSKQALRELELEFVEVSVDKHSNVREWLKEKTGKTSVPQIFFNDTHIGGNDSLQSSLKDDQKREKLLNILNEKYNSNLLIPTSSTAEDSSVSSFSCIPDPHADVIEDLVNAGIPQKMRLSLLSRKYEHAFSGEEFIKWFCEARETTEAESLGKGNQLLQKKFIIPLSNESLEMVNDSKVFYRLNESSTVKALNASGMNSCKIPAGNELSETLRNTVLELYQQFLSPDGKLVDYERMKASDQFSEYEKLSLLLQRVPVEGMAEQERKAFFVNVYNALVIHATIVNGPPKGFIRRFRFFSEAKYVIGGLTYSLNDIENGVLRGNKRGVLSIFPPFGKSDPRKGIALPKVDPRIHFALNCGAKSCPPIKTFSAQEIEKELQLATEAYLENDEGVTIKDTIGGKDEVMLSSLFRWYSSDFGESNQEVLRWVTEHLAPSDKKSSLEQTLEEGSWKISYLPYDWSSNSQ